MSLESSVIAPPVVVLTEAVMAGPADEVRPLPPAPAPTLEEIRAAEAVFAARAQESETVAGLMSLWAGVLLLNDLALDTFTPPAGALEEEEAARRKARERKDRDDQDA